MKIFLGSDHRGVELKHAVARYLEKTLNVEVIDLGVDSGAISANHIVYALRVATRVAGSADRGILICGSGIGMSIAANKVKGVRCALVSTPAQAVLTRNHNDTNIMAMSEQVSVEDACLIAKALMETPFLEGKYAERIAVLTQFEATGKVE